MNTAYVELESATVRAALYTFLEYSVVQHGGGDDKHLEPFKPDMKGRLHAFRSQAFFLEEPTIAPDGRYLAYNRASGESSLWMLTFTDAPSAAGP
jgi:hypothetical protein